LSLKKSASAAATCWFSGFPAFFSGLVCAYVPGMRLDMGKMSRSSVYHLISTVTPNNHASKAEFDAFGSVVVVVLLLGVVALVRLVLGWS
jgi:hypothetical protein